MGRRPGRRGIKKGGINDPVARNIRNQQNRDAAPTGMDAAETKRAHLANGGCRECGESDPGILDFYRARTHDCPTEQKRYKPAVLCEDCADGRLSYREYVIENARGEYDAVVFYECDLPTCRTFTHPTIEGQKGETFEDTRVPANADVELKCRCGAQIDDVVYLDGDGKGSGD